MFDLDTMVDDAKVRLQAQLVVDVQKHRAAIRAKARFMLTLLLRKQPALLLAPMVHKRGVWC